MTTYKKQLKDKDGNVIVPALGSGGVTTSEIADEAVTADKIDFSTLDYAYVVSSTSSVLTNSLATYATLDISSFPVGSVIEATVEMSSYSSTSTLAAMKIVVGCTEVDTGDEGVVQWYAWAGCACHTITFTKTSHATLCLKALNNNSSVTMCSTFKRISARRVK